MRCREYMHSSVAIHWPVKASRLYITMDSDLQCQSRLGPRYDAVRDMCEPRIVELWALISSAEANNNGGVVL